MTERIDTAVRRWLHACPGPFFAAHPLDTLIAAHSASGIKCSVDDFGAALERAGYRPRPHQSGVYCVPLPGVA